MEKHNPSSSPVHRSETVDRSAFENRLSFSVHDLSPYINWIYFFHAWGFQPRYAAIANIHGCDACRASWLTTFPEEERGKASEAMQLYKEANRMLDELDRDFEVKSVFKLCPANADGDNLISTVSLSRCSGASQEKRERTFLMPQRLCTPSVFGNH